MKVTDEMRDRMLFMVNVLGTSAAEAGRSLGCSGRAVSVTCNVFEAVRKRTGTSSGRCTRTPSRA